MFLHAVDQILDSDLGLSLVRLISHEGVLQELVCVGPLVVVLDEHGLDEVLELGAPPLRLESRRRVPGDEEEGTHGMHVAERRLGFRHLQRCDPQAPEIRSVVIRRVGVLVARNDLR